MRGRLGVLIGFGAGYVLGAKAGTERYHQLQRLYDNLLSSSALESVRGKAKGVASDGMHKVAGAVKKESPSGGLSVAPPPGG